MAARINNPTHYGVQSTIGFLNTKGLNTAQIHQKLYENYGSTVMSKRQVDTLVSVSLTNAVHMFTMKR